MKTGWTTHSWNGAIWLALSSCHTTMTCKINKLEKPGWPQVNFHALFGRSAAIYGHFRADAVTSEWSTHISLSNIGSTLTKSCYKSNKQKARSKIWKPRKSRKFFPEVFESEFPILAIGQNRKLGNDKTRKIVSEIS